VRKRLKEKQLDENFVLQERDKSAEAHENREIRELRVGS
jgi:hypothetical protein